jgi:hypothetical protein
MLLFFSGLCYRFCTREGSTWHSFCCNFFFCVEGDSESCLSALNIIEFSPGTSKTFLCFVLVCLLKTVPSWGEPLWQIQCVVILVSSEHTLSHWDILFSVLHHKVSQMNYLCFLFVFVSCVSCLFSSVVCVCVLCCFCYWPLGCLLTTVVIKNWIQLLLACKPTKLIELQAPFWRFRFFFYWLSSFNGAKWIALLMWQKKIIMNTEVHTVTFNHVSQNSHSAPSGCKIGKLMSWLQCLLGWWLWNKVL